MKTIPLLAVAGFAATLAGCAVVPLPEPAVVYAAPAPVVVVRPAYRHYGYYNYYGGPRYRSWR